MGHWRMSWASERAIRIGSEDPSTDARSYHLLSEILQSQSHLKHSQIHPSGGSVLIECTGDADRVWDLLQTTLESIEAESDSGPKQRSLREIIIPACYDVSLGLDLEAVAKSSGLSVDEVVESHSQRTYEVKSFGFMPGFAYCGKIDERLRLPRRDQPRARVSAGSIGIAEDMTAIYPHQSSGGWHIIGQTPVRMFDPTRSNPSLLNVGDRFRFEPIGLDRYHELKAASDG